MRRIVSLIISLLLAFPISARESNSNSVGQNRLVEFALDFTLAQMHALQVDSPTKLINVYFAGERRAAERKQLLKKVAAVHTLPKITRDGTRLHLTFSEDFSMDLDFSEIGENRILIDGVVWLIVPNRPLLPQIELMQKRLELAHPQKYKTAALEPRALPDSGTTIASDLFGRWLASSQGSQLFPGALLAGNDTDNAMQEFIDNWPPPKTPPKKTLMGRLKAAGGKIDRFGGNRYVWGILAIILGAVGTDGWAATVNSVCNMWYHGDFQDADIGPFCTGWAAREKQKLSSSDTAELLALAQKGYDTGALTCVRKRKGEDKTENLAFRGYSRKKDEEGNIIPSETYFIYAPYAKSDERSIPKEVYLFKPENRPFDQKAEANLRKAMQNQKNFIENIPPIENKGGDIAKYPYTVKCQVAPTSFAITECQVRNPARETDPAAEEFKIVKNFNPKSTIPIDKEIEKIMSFVYGIPSATFLSNYSCIDFNDKVELIKGAAPNITDSAAKATVTKTVPDLAPAPAPASAPAPATK